MAHGIRLLLTICVLIVLGRGFDCAIADDDPRMTEVRRIYAVWQGTKENRPAVPKDVPLPGMWKHGPTVGDVNEEVFYEAFLKIPFDAWSPETDADLLREGLRLSARGARSSGEPALGVDAAERFLARFGEHASAARIRAFDLPASLLATGDLTRAAAQAREHAGTLEQTLGARAWTLLGDLDAALGTFDAAAASYESGHALTFEPNTLDLSNEKDWARLELEYANRAARDGLDLRKRLLGTPLPKLVRSIGAGNATKALTKKAPCVVVLWFFSPSDDDDLSMLLELDALARSADPKRIAIVAVTWYENLREDYPDPRWMYVSESRDDLATGRVSVEKPSKLANSLKTLRKQLGLEVPIAIVKQAHAREWLPERMDALLVATNADRKVALVTDGEDRVSAFALLRAVIARGAAEERDK